MEFASFKHKGLRDFFENGSTRGISADQEKRLQKIFTGLASATGLDDLVSPPGWRLHQLKGDREGVWSISVTGNWRVTFTVENGELANVDLEDYH
jgi:proteic killer suppression protein